MTFGLASFLTTTLHIHKNKTAFVEQTAFRTKRTSYREIENGALKIAASFRELGITEGERIILWGENSARWVMTFYACVLSRVVAVPLDASFSQEFVERIKTITEARLVCADNDLASWNKLLDSAQTFIPDLTPAAPDALLEIIFTSGTTGDPKGVMITHGNILANLVPVHSEIQKYKKYAMFFSPLGFVHLIPLSHLFGQVMGVFIPQMLGGKVIFADHAPPQVQRAVKMNRASAVICVPHELSLLRNMVERRHVLKLESELPVRQGIAGILQRWWRYRAVHRMFGWKFWAFIVGGATLSAEEERFWSRLGYAVIQGYGLTETAPSVTITHPFKGIVQGSVGKVLPGLEVKIAEDGEVLVRGPNVSPGYFRNEDASREMFEDGWLRTGDLGRFEENGNLILLGRKKEVIVLAGGMNVFPQDLEDILNRDSRVRESAIVNSASDDKPRVHAVLVLHDLESAEDVIRSANKQLQTHQQILSWSIWSEKELPRTSTGKLKRLAIRSGSVIGVSQESQVERLALQILEGRSESHPEGDLSLSSLERLELMMELEEKAGVEFNETEFANAKTVSDVSKLIASPVDRTVKQEADAYDPWKWRLWFPLRIFRSILWYLLLSPLMSFRMRIEVSGLENLKKVSPPVLFVSNHQSILDAPVILRALPPRWRRKLSAAMGTNRPKLDLMASSFFFNTYPLPVTGVGLRGAIQHTAWLADHDYSPLVFPEGKRTVDGSLLPFRQGIGVIVKETGLQVLPIIIRGAFEIWPEHARGPRKGTIQVQFGQPMDFSDQEPTSITSALESWYVRAFPVTK